MAYVTNNIIYKIRELFNDYQDFHNRVITNLQTKIN